MPHDRPQPVEDVATEQSPRDMTCVSAGEPHLATLRELESDLRARVSRADDEHWPVRQLEGIAILARVELANTGRQPLPNQWNVRSLKGACRNDDVLGLDERRTTLRAKHKMLTVPGQRIHARAQPNG